MGYFLETTDTIEAGVGFSHYGLLHICWLVLAAATMYFVIRGYCKRDEETRARWRKNLALLIIADEIWKMFWLAIGGNYTLDYLPLHLCSINIILIAIHAWRPSKTLDNFLYLVCIPGALSALLFPSWVSLPLANFMHLHSFTVHTMLVLYPLMLTIAGDIKPEIKQFPKALLFLVILAVPIAIFNVVFDTNFMFLMFVEEGNPLMIFESLWGNHLLGYPVLLSAITLVMCIPAWIMSKKRSSSV